MLLMLAVAVTRGGGDGDGDGDANWSMQEARQDWRGSLGGAGGGGGGGGGAVTKTRETVGICLAVIS